MKKIYLPLFALALVAACDEAEAPTPNTNTSVNMTDIESTGPCGDGSFPGPDEDCK